MIEGELIGHQSVREVLNSHNLDKETSDWAEKWYNRGRLRLDILSDKSRLLETKFRHFVATHELSHAIVARKLGWVVKEIFIYGTGAVKGFVSISSPRKTRSELENDIGAISIAGSVGTRSHAGTGSDVAQLEASHPLATRSVISLEAYRDSKRRQADGLVGNRNIVEYKAFDLLKLKAA